jgi:glucokinase
MRKILAADIGGTNSRFALFEVVQGGYLVLTETQWLKTDEFLSFHDLLSCLKQGGFPFHSRDIDIAVFAVAGPVENGVKSFPPFISWDIDITIVKTGFGIDCCVLINDFVAHAYACLSTVGKSSLQILPGQAASDGTIAVIGAGTALGKAALIPDGKGGYIAMPSEGGHTNFPFASQREFEFHDFMKDELGDRYITFNKVVSGNGLSLVHKFLSGEELEPREVANSLAQYPETLEWASRFYARACRSFALETLSTGGLYIAGGVAANSPELVTGNAFASEFRSSDTLSHVLADIPVYLFTDQNAGLWGGAVLGAQTLLRNRE